MLRSMLDGFKFNFKMEGLRVSLFGLQPHKYQRKPVPLLDFEIGVVAVLVSIKKELLSADIHLREITMTEYYRRESMRSYSRQVNSLIGNHLLTSVYDDEI